MSAHSDSREKRVALRSSGMDAVRVQPSGYPDRAASRGALRADRGLAMPVKGEAEFLTVDASEDRSVLSTVLFGLAGARFRSCRAGMRMG